jgi:hypothetical protein
VKTIGQIKDMVADWLSPEEEACLDRLAQIYSEDLFRLERAGAGGVDVQASDLYEAFDTALQMEYEEQAGA